MLNAAAEMFTYLLTMLMFDVVTDCKQELDEKQLVIEFYKDQEQVYQQEIEAYKRVEASVCHDTCIRYTDD